MKTMMLLAFFLFQTQFVFARHDVALQRSNKLLMFMAEQEILRDFAMGTVIKARCSRYAPDVSGCKDGVDRMIKHLNFDIVILEKEKQINPHVSFVFLAFKNHFFDLLNSPKTDRFLKELNEKLYEHMLATNSTFNIWEYTLKHYPDQYNAAMVMAVLFQDTSPMMLHLGWVQRTNPNTSATFKSGLERLARVTQTINLILDTGEENYRTLFYPKQVAKYINKNIYHFYVPLFLAMKLKKDGFTAKNAVAAPFMLTLTYEFITAADDYRYVYFDPERLDARAEYWKLVDIYGSYSGAHFGIRSIRPALSFDLTSEFFDRSTEDAIRLLLDVI